jgi:hypothetical protein
VAAGAGELARHDGGVQHRPVVTETVALRGGGLAPVWGG